MSAPYVHRLRVRYNECDPQGIVFNANYVTYFDHTFTELWRQAFGSYQAMTERGLDMVVAELNVEFRGSARFDDLVDVETTIERLGQTSMTTRLDVLREEELLVRGRIRHVFMDAETWAKTEIPDWVRGGLRAYLATTAERS